MVSLQSEKRVSGQVTVGIGVTGIDISSTCTVLYLHRPGSGTVGCGKRCAKLMAHAQTRQLLALAAASCQSRIRTVCLRRTHDGASLMTVCRTQVPSTMLRFKSDPIAAPLGRVGVRPRFSTRSTRQPRCVLHCSHLIAAKQTMSTERGSA